VLPRHRLALASAALALALLYAGPARAEWPGDPTANVALTTAAGDQSYVVGRSEHMISDGAGGAIVVWHDLGLNSANEVGVFAQRVLADGTRAWGANGVAICAIDSFQVYPALVSDGAGGAIITWFDSRSGRFDIYAQRVNAAGVRQWATNGVPICTAVNDQAAPTIVSDGAGGAIIAWTDLRGVGSDIYAQRVNGAGVVQWTANGVALCSATGDQVEPRIVEDGANGAIVSWYDYRVSVSNSDIYARRISAAGTPLWTVNGVALCTAVNLQRDPRMVSDGAGGAIVAWSDERAGGSSLDVYAQRVTSAGAVSWLVNGLGLGTGVGFQYAPAIVSDGSGGAIVSWQDSRSGLYDVYAQRVNGAGTIQWAGNGAALCVETGNQYNVSMTADGTGGAIVAWEDYRSTVADVYAQRVTGAGAAQWLANGLAVSTAASDQTMPLVVSDLAGGGVFVWQDFRNGNVDLFAQGVDVTGYLGDPPPQPPDPTLPVIDAVADVPNDQGGKVMVRWQPSSLDAAPSYGIASYTLWRRILTSSAAAALDQAGEPGPGSLLVTGGAGTQSEYWEFVVTLPAIDAPGYAYMAPTGSDSLPGSIPWNVFLVQARAAASVTFYNSLVDSGYSVDNLSPSAPAQFTGNFASGATHLHWTPNAETDLSGYRLYRGTSEAFVPGPANLIASPPDTGYSDAGIGYYYKLSAVDVHGNESPHTLLSPLQTTDVGDGAQAVLSLAMASSNPARSQIRLRYALARAGEARLTVYNVAGRMVRVLESGLKPAGEYTAQWDGRDEFGRAAGSGMYLVRLEASSGSAAVRCILLQ
jgi:predicted lipoprotein with Yx(FWY)xxD motif